MLGTDICMLLASIDRCIRDYCADNSLNSMKVTVYKRWRIISHSEAHAILKENGLDCESMCVVHA